MYLSEYELFSILQEPNSRTALHLSRKAAINNVLTYCDHHGNSGFYQSSVIDGTRTYNTDANVIKAWCLYLMGYRIRSGKLKLTKRIKFDTL